MIWLRNIFVFAVSAICLAISPVRAADREGALNNAALAAAYVDRCTSLKVDWLDYAEMLDKAGVDIDKLESPAQVRAMADRMTKAEIALKRVPDADVCGRAVADFGPKGKRSPGLLSGGIGAALQNKFLDWLDK